LSEIDVELITNNIREKIKKTKLENELLLTFIATELSKSDIQNKNDVLDRIIDYLDTKYSTKQEVKTILQNKLEDLKKSQISPDDLLLEQVNRQSLENIIYTGDESDPSLYVNLRKLINRLEKNKDLTNLMDGVLHFGKRHMSVAKRIFFLQVTQNYLSAIKYMTINELVNKQTLFNMATEDAIKNMINLINDLRKQTEISITELKNYQHESQRWILNDEDKIRKLEVKLTDDESFIASQFPHYESLFKSKLEKNNSMINDKEHILEIKINENYNELKELIITRDIKTTEFFLEKISNIENMIKQIKEEKQKKSE